VLRPLTCKVAWVQESGSDRGCTLRSELRSGISRSMLFLPCLPTTSKRPPTGSAWVHEIKHDGYRLIVRVAPGVIGRESADQGQLEPAAVPRAAQQRPLRVAGIIFGAPAPTLVVRTIRARFDRKGNVSGRRTPAWLGNVPDQLRTQSGFHALFSGSGS
jgi:hypothetical protein